MKNLIRLKESRTVRPVWLSAWAAAVLAAAAAVAGIVPGQGSAAPTVRESSSVRISFIHLRRS